VSSGITEPKNMNAPSNNIIILDLIHVFPHKLMMPPQTKRMVVKLRPCAKHICFRAHLFVPACRKYLHFHRIHCVILFVGEVHDYCFEAVIRSALEDDGLMLGFVPDVAHICSSEFKKLTVLTFVALEELLLSLGVLTHVQDGIKGTLVLLFVGLGLTLVDHFFII
jgi:hypothetical protein